VPDGSQWLASGTLYSKNMLISGKNRAVASTYFKADATAPFLCLKLRNAQDKGLRGCCLMQPFCELL
jgi:hypothetical protein